MSLLVAYELGFALTATFALLCNLLGGELPLLAWASLAAPPLAALQHARGRAIAGWLGTAIGALALAQGAATIVARGVEALLLAAAVAVVGIFAARILTRRTPTHDLQAMLVSLLLVFSGAGLNTSVSYGVLFALYAISAAWALVTRQLVAGAYEEAARPGGARIEATLARRDIVTPALFFTTAAVSVVILASTLVLFAIFPRVGIGRFGLQLQRGSLPQDVSLRGPPMAGGTATVVARVSGVSYDDFLRGLYLRISVYDTPTADGFGRAGALISRRQELFAPAGAGAPRRYEVFLQPIAGERLGVLGPTERVDVVAGGHANPSLRTFGRRIRGDGEVQVQGALSGPIRYRVMGSPSLAAWDLPADRRGLPLPEELGELLALPPSIDPRIPALARQVTAGATSAASRAEALRRFLDTSFGYTLEQPNGAAEDPLAAFLFEDRRGHCEYFATALAAMLRAVGVPSRVIGGLQGGHWDEEAQMVIFTAMNAHAWVEWYDPELGWVLDDATPAATSDRAVLAGVAALVERMRRAWDDYILDYGIREQLALLSTLANRMQDARVQLPRLPERRTLVLTAAAALSVAALSFSLRHRPLARGRREDAIATAIVELIGRIERRPVPANHTLREAVEGVRSKLGATDDVRGALDDALQLYEIERFAGRRLPAARRHAALRRLVLAGRRSSAATPEQR